MFSGGKEKVKACNFIKKRLWHRCFPVNLAKFLRTPNRTPLVAASDIYLLLKSDSHLPEKIHILFPLIKALLK